MIVNNFNTETTLRQTILTIINLYWRKFQKTKTTLEALIREKNEWETLHKI